MCVPTPKSRGRISSQVSRVLFTAIYEIIIMSRATYILDYIIIQYIVRSNKFYTNDDDRMEVSVNQIAAETSQEKIL